MITGFDPFGGESVNPSWMAVNQMPDHMREWELTKLQIPTICDTAAKSDLPSAYFFFTIPVQEMITSIDVL